MNGARNVQASLSRRVWQAVSETEYVPNRHAQALISGRTRLIGLLVPDIMNPFFPELIHGFEQAATAQGFGILIGSTHDKPYETEEWVRRMLQHGVESLALLTFRQETPQVYHLLRHLPTVQLEVSTDPSGPELVVIDYDSGIREAIQHLAALGHQRIGFAAGATLDFTAELRRASFRKATRALGLTAKGWIIDEDHSLEGGMAAARKFLARKARPTALLCSNDLMAIGALRVLHSAGIQVPADMSLIGLDDIHLAEFTSPPLTTVRLPRTQLAEACFEVLLRKIRPAEAPAQKRSVRTNLVIRHSTGSPAVPTAWADRD